VFFLAPEILGKLTACWLDNIVAKYQIKILKQF